MSEYNQYMYPTADYPSPTLSWHLRESEKRSKGLDNELDHADIRAAARGVKNKWYERYQSDPKRFQGIVQGKSYDWNEIVNYCVK